MWPSIRIAIHVRMWRHNSDLAVAINRKTNGLITPPPKWVSAQLLLLQSCEKGPSIKYPPPPNFVLISCKAKICSKKRPPRWPCAVKTHWRIMEKSKVTNSEWLLSTDQHTFLDTKEAWLRFVLWTPVKSSDQEPRKQSNQGRFSLIKILDPSRKRFYGQRVCDYPL